MAKEVFVGIDISKDFLDVGVMPTGEFFRETHDVRGLKSLVKRLTALGPSLVVLEATGGYEMTVWTALEKAKMKLEQMDLVEVNEAFAAQYLAVEQELGLDRERTNVDGGAIAIGHPLGASGARITLHLLHALRRRGGRYGLGSACIGGGQGAAVIVEAFSA